MKPTLKQVTKKMSLGATMPLPVVQLVAQANRPHLPVGRVHQKALADQVAHPALHQRVELIYRFRPAANLLTKRLIKISHGLVRGR